MLKKKSQIAIWFDVKKRKKYLCTGFYSKKRKKVLISKNDKRFRLQQKKKIEKRTADLNSKKKFKKMDCFELKKYILLLNFYNNVFLKIFTEKGKNNGNKSKIKNHRVKNFSENKWTKRHFLRSPA